MKEKNIEIGGEIFELCGTTNTVGRATYVSWNNPEDIYHHYARPSEIKNLFGTIGANRRLNITLIYT